MNPVRSSGLAAASLALLTSGCVSPAAQTPTSAPPSRPVGATTASPNSIPPPTGGPAATPARIALLPPPCLRSQVRVSRRPWRDGATGWSFAGWRVRLVAGAPACSLSGRPRLRAYDESGGRPLRVWHAAGDRPTAVLRPGQTAMIVARKYRCDLGEPIGRIVRVRLGLPGVPGWYDVEAAPFAVCGTGEAGASYQLTLDLDGGHPRPPVAVSMFDPRPPRFPFASWGRADLDADGRPETVVVRPDGRISVTDAGRTGSARAVTSGPARLQGLADLDGDGRAEILVATWSTGCCRYRPENWRTAIIAFVNGRPVRIARPDPWFDVGAGNRYGGISCGHGHFQEAWADVPWPGQDWMYQRDVLGIDRRGPRVGLREMSTDHWLNYFHTAAAARQATRTRCAGLDADGWATR